jgi:hypothetical protein
MGVAVCVALDGAVSRRLMRGFNCFISQRRVPSLPNKADYMTTNRRGFLATLGATVGTIGMRVDAAPFGVHTRAESTIDAGTPWDAVRALFELRTDRIHMSGLVFASHPQPVREAIAKHREELQRDPVTYISHERWRLEAEVLASASSYLGVAPADIALTDRQYVYGPRPPIFRSRTEARRRSCDNES